MDFLIAISKRIPGIAGATGAIGETGPTGAIGLVGPTGIGGVIGAAGLITNAKRVDCNVSCTGIVCEESTITCAYDNTSTDVNQPIICTTSPTKCSTPVCICT